MESATCLADVHNSQTVVLVFLQPEQLPALLFHGSHVFRLRVLALLTFPI